MAIPRVERLADGLLEHTGGFAKAVDGVDPGTQVPTCPEWRLRDLVGHIGQAHRWAAGIVRTRQAAATPDPRAADPGPPAGWTSWLLDGAEELIAAVEQAGDAQVWAFFGTQPAAFWLRRMLHDTAVHHADAAITAGVPFEIAPDLAADAITEVLGLLSAPGVAEFRPALAELRGQGQTLRWQPESGPGWLITRTPEGLAWEHVTTAGDADVTVAGAMRDLLLVFTRRLPADDDRVTITGDRALLDHWLAKTAI